MTEYEFARKPRRMTDPPHNNRDILSIYDAEVRLELDPARIAYFAREATWGDIMHEPTAEELADTLKEVEAGKVLGAAKEVPALGFRIRASRSCMDQMLRLRESAGGAQTTRDNDQRDFNIVIPKTIDSLWDPAVGITPGNDLYADVLNLLDQMRTVYGDLVDAGVPPQDARYVALPLGFQTHWIQIMNLRAFEKMCEQRLCCGLTQHETVFVVQRMRDLVVEEMPWTAGMLRSSCAKRGACTTGTMLFPPCGAHGDVSTEFDPDKHLYPVDANTAMELVRKEQSYG